MSVAGVIRHVVGSDSAYLRASFRARLVVPLES